MNTITLKPEVNCLEAIQIAIDALAYRGGGTLILSKGVYPLGSAIQLRDGVHLRGSRGTWLEQAETTKTYRLTEMLDDQDVRLKADRRIPIGSGIAIIPPGDPGGWSVTQTEVISYDEGYAIISDAARISYPKNSICLNQHPLIKAADCRDVTVSNLGIRGVPRHESPLSGCINGAIYLYKCEDVRIENCKIYSYDGDGISMQKVSRVAISKTIISDVSGIGVHPGTVATDCAVEHCRINKCGKTGVYLCWQVTNCRVINNSISKCTSGVSIGHKDHHNIIEGNIISDCQYTGIYFEPVEYAGDWNIIRGNTIRNCCRRSAGSAIEQPSAAKNNRFSQNTFEKTVKSSRQDNRIQQGAEPDAFGAG